MRVALRIVLSLVAFGVAFALTAWQNQLVLEVVNRPLPDDLKPIAFGVAEPFTTTLADSASAAVLLALPLILCQLYAFVLPAFSPAERRVAAPLLPILFVGGVAFY